MLIDDYVAAMKKIAFDARRPEAADAALMREIGRAQRFVLSPLCVRTIDDLVTVETAERSRDYVFAPAENTWLEWSGPSIPGSNRNGLLLIGADDTRGRSLLTGDGQFVFDAEIPGRGRTPIGVPIVYDFPGDGSILRPQIKRAWEVISRMAPQVGNFDFNALGSWIIGALALINTPRISHVREAELGRLNRAREKKHRPPILSHKIVTIKIDSGELGNGFQKTQTGERALHHVRAFMRLRKGKVEIVRPHWRGNPRFGVIMHRYVAMRAEDEAGPWKGGPVPPPRVIRELEE